MTFAIESRYTVVKIEEKFGNVHVSGTGKEAVFAFKSLGWFVTVYPGNITFGVGTKKPVDLDVGNDLIMVLKKR